MKYAALLRGIGPGNPNMRNDKIRTVFEKVGLKNVKPIISSGNFVFESTSANASALEAKLEKTFPAELGFKSTTIIRSKAELEKLVKRKPFGKKLHSRETYLLVTFLKNRGKEICTVHNVKENPTPDFMTKLEKKHGKEMTSRTWKTVERILAKMA